MQTEWVTLTDAQIEMCKEVALKRRQAARATGRIPRNGAPIDHDLGMQDEVRGILGEYAGKLYLDPVSWNGFSETVNRRIADLEDWIDVKTIKYRGHSLVVQRTSPKEWANLLVCAERHPDYEIIGWCWGHEAQIDRFWPGPRPDMPAYFIKSSDTTTLKAPSALHWEVRCRQYLLVR